MRRTSLLLTAAFAFGISPLARAQLVSYAMEGVIASSDATTSFAVGDPFRISFILGMDGRDSSQDPAVGFFPAVQMLRFDLLDGSTGNYPAASSTQGFWFELDHSNAGDSVNFTMFPAITSANFSMIGGTPLTFFRVDLVSTNPLLFSLPPGDETELSEMLVRPLANEDFDSQRRLWLAFDDAHVNINVYGEIQTITVVPEPSASALVQTCAAFIGACVVLWRRVMKIPDRC